MHTKKLKIDDTKQKVIIFLGDHVELSIEFDKFRDSSEWDGVSSFSSTISQGRRLVRIELLDRETAEIYFETEIRR